MSLARIRLLVPLLCFAGAALSGCAFDSGHDYAVTVTWLINGKAPTAELCRQQGVDRVRLNVRGPSKTRSIDAPCASQVELVDEDNNSLWYGGFDSTASFNYDVVYDYTVEMIDAAGNALPDLAYTSSFQVFYGDPEPWVLDPLELFAPLGTLASVSAEWTFEKQAPTAELCQRAGATEVLIDVASSTDYDFEDYVTIARASCTDAGLVTDPVLAEGDYYIRYALLDANGEPIPEQDRYLDDQLFTVDRSGELALDTADFDLP